MTPYTGSLPNTWYVPSVSPSLNTGLPSIGTRRCQAMFWWEDVHQVVVIHELCSRPWWFLSPDATSRRPSISADRTDGDSGYQQHGDYPSVLPMGFGLELVWLNDLMPLCFSIVYAYLFPCLSFLLFFADSFFLTTHWLFWFVTNCSHILWCLCFLLFHAFLLFLFMGRLKFWVSLRPTPSNAHK